MVAVAESEINFTPGRPQYKSAEELQNASVRKCNLEPEFWYPRDIDPYLKQMENKAGELLGVDGRNVVGYSYGMTAIREVVESAYPTSGSRILWDAGYSQTRKLFGDKLPRRGIRSAQAQFDTSSAAEMKAAIERFNPDMAFFETMGNNPYMRLPNIEALLEAIKDKKTLAILDHTLPFSTGRDLAPMLKSSGQDVVVVYSGTKAFGQNSWVPSGFAVTFNEERLKELLEIRTMDGARIPPPSVALSEPLMRLSKAEFDERLLKIYGNTLFLARASAEQRNDLAAVRHPNVGDHPHRSYADRTYLAQNGGSPVFFIELVDPEVFSQFDLIRALGGNERITKYCGFGTSFGFNQTALLHDQYNPFVRVSPGTESPEVVEEIATGFQEVLATIKPRERTVYYFGETG